VISKLATEKNVLVLKSNILVFIKVFEEGLTKYQRITLNFFFSFEPW